VDSNTDPETLCTPARQFLYTPGSEGDDPILAAAHDLALAVLEFLFHGGRTPENYAKVQRASRVLEQQRLR
jgi:hypothetical protein